MATIFRTIVADPPWSFNDKLGSRNSGFGAKRSRGRGAANVYHCMGIDEIKAYLPTSTLEVAKDARLFLWRVAAMQPEALDVCEAWGFAPKTEIVWHKMTTGGKEHFGMGRTVRAAHETVLVGQRGQPERLSASVRSVFAAPYTGHSAKPDAFYELVEKLSPGPYLDLFARRERPGWVCLGDELGC